MSSYVKYSQPDLNPHAKSCLASNHEEANKNIEEIKAMGLEIVDVSVIDEDKCLLSYPCRGHEGVYLICSNGDKIPYKCSSVSIACIQKVFCGSQHVSLHFKEYAKDFVYPSQPKTPYQFHRNEARKHIDKIKEMNLDIVDIKVIQFKMCLESDPCKGHEGVFLICSDGSEICYKCPSVTIGCIQKVFGCNNKHEASHFADYAKYFVYF